VRVAYFGLPLGALSLLEDGQELLLAVLSPVEAPGRRRLSRRGVDSRVVDAARVSRSQLAREVGALLAAAASDLVVSWYWTRKLPRSWLASARLGGIGVHPSLLPRHRGPNPFYAAIDSGDALTGVTVHRLEDEYDTGAVLAQRSLAIGERDSWQLARALDRPGLALLRETILQLDQGKVLPEVAQDEAFATQAPEPSGDGLGVRWSWPTARVLRRVRALAPVPGLAIELGDAKLFVTRAHEVSHYPRVLRPGEAAVQDEPPGVVVRTGDGAILLERGVILGADDDAAELDGPAFAALLKERSDVVG
jgi:methionyl-tRNA formyltransferase